MPCRLAGGGASQAVNDAVTGSISSERWSAIEHHHVHPAGAQAPHQLRRQLRVEAPPGIGGLLLIHEHRDVHIAVGLSLATGLRAEEVGLQDLGAALEGGAQCQAELVDALHRVEHGGAVGGVVGPAPPAAGGSIGLPPPAPAA